ncbi:hypothetical protein FB639_004894, partial [Coemansia asiatica]
MAAEHPFSSLRRAPSWMLANDEEAGRSSSDAPSRTKRAQVKNACVNCQRACKKCDSGRPCQRCVKYNLQESCVDSKRKPRKKGIKRGPYKKRKKNTDDTVSLDTQQQQPTEVAGSVDSSGQASGSGSVRARSTMSKRSGERTRPRGLLGPGMVPILQSDPHGNDDSDDQSSSSDTPLVAARQTQPQPTAYRPPPPRLSLHAASSAPQPARLLPETPTMGLTAAFGTLATTPSGPSFPQPARYSQRPSSTGLPFAHTSGAIRLPPITSLVCSAPPTPLSLLTDIALSSTQRRQPPPPAAAVRPSTPTANNPAPYISIPSLPDRPSSQPAEDTEQQSALLQPPDDAHSRHSTTTASDDQSSNNGDADLAMNS